MKKRRQKNVAVTGERRDTEDGLGGNDAAVITTMNDNDDTGSDAGIDTGAGVNVSNHNEISATQPRHQTQPVPGLATKHRPTLALTSTFTPTSAPTPQTLALDALKLHCQTHNIFISPLLAAQSYPSRGLGVYAIRPIHKGMKLIHVPTKSLFTTQSIPESFLSKSARKNVSVHCALAMFLAFGDGEGESGIGGYRSWMDTWPGWEGFLEEMPVFWRGDFRVREEEERVEEGGGGRVRKRRKTLSDVTTGIRTTSTAAAGGGGKNSMAPTRKLPVFSRSPGIDAVWLTQPSAPEYPVLPSHLSSQAYKIRSCIDAVDKYFPHLQIRSPASHTLYLRFLHMWSCVNTRCFYYLRPGQAAPEDSNEAMALCAFQDLFNHSDARGCTSMFDKRGYFIHADRDYEVGEELLLRYGQHDNDMLWMEYGFFMDKNKHDTMRLDQVVLAEFDEKEKEALKQCEYFGQYNVKTNGVCYRTVVASYLGILDKKQWKRFVAGGLDPEVSTALEEVRLKAKRRIVKWILLVRREAEHNLRVILGIKEENELTDCFVDEASLTEKQQQSRAAKVELARRRKAMCVHRWRQIFDVCMHAIQETEKEFPGSFAIGESDVIEQKLKLTSDEFVRTIDDEKS